MTELENIFNTVTHSSDKWQPYFEIYERHVNRFRKNPINLVEVGVQKGGSLEMWSKYLHPNSNITGIDIDPECSNLKYEQSNIKVIIGDQGIPGFWDDFLASNTDIDVFLDDGGHTMEQQILTFEKVFPKMPVGSVFMCEDCHTSYMASFGSSLKNPGSFIEYAKNYVDVLHSNWIENPNTEYERYKTLAKDLSGVFFYDSIVVFEKFGKRSMHRVFPKH
jgi:hypothetical protein